MLGAVASAAQGAAERSMAAAVAVSELQRKTASLKKEIMDAEEEPDSGSEEEGEEKGEAQAEKGEEASEEDEGGVLEPPVARRVKNVRAMR